MTGSQLESERWIQRLGAELEAIAEKVEPPTELWRFFGTPPLQSREGDRVWYLRKYRALATIAKTDRKASQVFDAARLSLDFDCERARSILREHPLVRPGLVGSGNNETILFRFLNQSSGFPMTLLVPRLVKLSIKEGGEEAARRLDRCLVAGETRSLPAQEISVFHGLIVNGRHDLGRDAYLAPYDHARVEFDLPTEPEPFTEKSNPNAAVLVRGLRYGPGVAPPHEGPGLSSVQVTYDFPTEYQTDLEGWFDDFRLLIDLLSIAAEVPLLARTSYVRLAKWVEEMDPGNLSCLLNSGGHQSDVWPRGCDLSPTAIDAFEALSRDWRPAGERSEAIKLAIRRLAASYSRPGGRFDIEDRIFDIAIALEVLYGGKTGLKLALRAAALLGATAEEQISIFDQATRFYDVRSKIIHAKGTRLERDLLEVQLNTGRTLGRQSLVRVLSLGAPPQWAEVRRNLRKETNAHIEAERQRRESGPSVET